MDSSYKLPVQQIITASIYILWVNKIYYSKALAIPVLLMAVLWGMWHLINDNVGLALLFLFIIVLIFSYFVFVITCHRLILINTKFNIYKIDSYISKRVVLFFISAFVVYFCVSIVDMLPKAILYNLNNIFDLDVNEDDWMFFPVYIPGLYILGRICLVLPAKAIDDVCSIKKSWNMTKNNGWRMFLIVGFYPWILGMVLWLFWKEDANVFENILLTFLGLLISVIEIFAISLSYKELASKEKLFSYN
jgi:hypothetical protein